MPCRAVASASESIGDTETAISLLRAITDETADAPEDQMARLKLGQLLRAQQPAESRSVLNEFLSRYPQSEWAHMVRESLQTYV